MRQVWPFMTTDSNILFALREWIYPSLCDSLCLYLFNHDRYQYKNLDLSLLKFLKYYGVIKANKEVKQEAFQRFKVIIVVLSGKKQL